MPATERDAPDDLTTEEAGDWPGEERLEREAQQRRESLEGLHPDQVRGRFHDLDGNYQRPEATGVEWTPDDESGKRAEQLAYLSDAAAKAVRQFRREVEEIESDDRLSDEYRQQKKRELAREYLSAESANDPGGDLVFAEMNTRRIRARVEENAPEFRVAPEPDPDDAVSALREREYRDHLRSLAGEENPDGSSEHLSTAREWARSDDPMKVRAVFGGTPEMAGFNSAENRERLRQEVLEERHGEEIDELRGLTRLADTAEHNIETARREIASLGGIDIE